MDARNEIRETLRIKTSYEECISTRASEHSAAVILVSHTSSFAIVVLGVIAIVKLVQLAHPGYMLPLYNGSAIALLILAVWHVRTANTRLQIASRVRDLVMRVVAVAPAPVLHARITRFNALVERYAAYASTIKHQTQESLRDEITLVHALLLIRKQLLKKKRVRLKQLQALELAFDEKLKPHARKIPS